MIYNIRDNEWLNGQDLPYGIDEHATVIGKSDIIYVFGGNCENLIKYKNGKWIQMKTMTYNKCNHIALQYDNFIYALSGYIKDEADDVPISEYYNISTDIWCDINSKVFDGINKNNCVYDSYEYLLYAYIGKNIYCISMDNFTKSLRYSNIEKINTDVSKLILM